MKNIGKNERFSPRAGQSTQTVQLAEAGPVSPRKPVKTKRNSPAELEDHMYLEANEIARFFRVIESKRDKAIFRLVYHRGLRAHEVALMQFSDFRERDGVLYVRRGKGSISREHSLIREELTSLRAWIKVRGAHPGPMFPSRQGSKGITRTRLDQIMKSYCQAAGIRPEKAHMHALKHSCGTHLRERGNSAANIQDWLGHRCSKSTDIYMHFTRTMRREAFEKNQDWK
jgi:integrase